MATNTRPYPESRDIAVVGAGVAGLTAATFLDARYRVTIYEQNNYLGGHTNTIEIPDGPDAGTPVDTGFIVMNHRNYPLLTKLFTQLEIALQDAEMSFGYRCEETGMEYAGTNLNTLFAQRGNLLRPRFYGMIRDILRFYREAGNDLDTGNVGRQTLGDYLESGGYKDSFVHHHLLPMGAAIWSTPCEEMLKFPASAFLHFLRNHGLLSLNDRPQWRTVVGGSRRYVKVMMKQFAGIVRLNTGVNQIRRTDNGIELTLNTGDTCRHDAVVIATHADESLETLADPSDLERDLLFPWTYQPNHTILHRDAEILPKNKRARASWNYCRERTGENAVSLTYDMNRLQGLNTAHPYLVSLNRKGSIRESAIVFETVYTHPVYTVQAMDTQPRLHELNGKRNTWFCGSYFGYGFHEDAVRSAVQVLHDFGIAI